MNPPGRLRSSRAACAILAAVLAGTTGDCDPGPTPEPRLEGALLRIAPTDAQMRTLPEFPARWTFSAESVASLGVTLVERGLPGDLVDELMSRLTIDPRTGDWTIAAEARFLDRFSPEARAEWFRILAVRRANETYRWPLVVDEARLDRLAARAGWAEPVERIRRWSVRRGDRCVFGDLFALDDAFIDDGARRDFLRAALETEVEVLRLVVEKKDGVAGNVGQQAAWWQVNGRFRAIEPFLNAVGSVEERDRIDVAHLLPRLPRSLLYTFSPDLAGADDPGIESAMMAAAFFGLAEPIDAHRSAGFAGWLRRECVPQDGPLQFGDILVFEDPQRRTWPYAAVYVSNGMLFGRRPTAFGPWQFLRREDIGSLNPRFEDRAPRTYRLKRAVRDPAAPAFDPERKPAAWRRPLHLLPVAEGPWGRLWTHDVLLAPPGDTLESLPPPDRNPEWTFTGITPGQAATIIESIEMPPSVRRELVDLFRNASPGAAEGSFSVRPTMDLVLATPREVRAELYEHLVGGDVATDFVQHIAFPAGYEVDQWFDQGSLPAPAREAILRLAYPARGGGFALSDYGALYHVLDTPSERLFAQRAALRVPGLVVVLEKPRPDEVSELAEYWRYDQGKSIRTLLESFAASGDEIRYLDIVHLLPPVAREFVNSYFIADGPSLAPSCFWTAFNFGSEWPDGRYLVLPGTWTEHRELAWTELNGGFDRIDEPSALGDIIAYRRRGVSAIEHVCTYIAGDIVYTKDGFTFSAPWRLARLGDVDATYLGATDMERLVFRAR